MSLLARIFRIFSKPKKEIVIEPSGLYILNELKKYLSDEEFSEIVFILEMENDVIRHTYIQDFFNDPHIHNKLVIMGDPSYIATQLSKSAHSSV